MIGCPIRYPLVTAYLFFILVSFWYGQSRRGSQHSCQKAQKSPGTLRSQGFPHAVSLAFHGGDKRDRTADLLNAIQALSRLDRLHTPLNRANRAFNTRDTPPKAAKPSAFFLKFIIAGARPHINTKFENKLDTAIPFSHGIISLFHSERGC